MLQRFLVYILLAFGLIVLARGCTRQLQEVYDLMHVRVVGGKAYALVEYFDKESDEPSGRLFNIHTPTSPAWDQWSSVVDNRNGPVFGMAMLPGGLAGKSGSVALENWLPSEDVVPAGTIISTIPPANNDRLLAFFTKRVSVYDPAANPPTHHSEPLPIDWPAETGAVLNGKVYIFGADFTVTSRGEGKGPLRAARFDGARWTELPVMGPDVSAGPNGFYLQAVTSSEGIRVFWRKWDREQTLGLLQEGVGPLETALFDGEQFTAIRQIQNLPAGNVSAFAASDGVRLLIQTRAPPEEAITQNGALEIWALNSTGDARQVEVIEESRVKPGLLPFVFAEYVQLEEKEYILRSNSQLFEVWKRDANGNWAFLRNPGGLKTFDLETKLLVALGMCLALIAFSAGAAYRRRQITLSLTRKIEAQELYASLGLRMGAYAVDFAIVVAVAYGFARMLDSVPSGLLGIVLRSDFPIPYMPYFFAYMMYFTLSEWLVGATVGKMMMGLRVVMDGGAPLSFWAAMVRNFVGFYERLPLFIFVPLSMILFGPRRQRMGDILSRTFVVQRGALEVFQRQRAEELAQMRETFAESAEKKESNL